MKVRRTKYMFPVFLDRRVDPIGIGKKFDLSSDMIHLANTIQKLYDTSDPYSVSEVSVSGYPVFSQGQLSILGNNDTIQRIFEKYVANKVTILTTEFIDLLTPVLPVRKMSYKSKPRDGPDPRIAKMDEIHKGSMSMISNVQALVDEVRSTLLTDDEVGIEPAVDDMLTSLDKLLVELTKSVAFFGSIPGTLASTSAAITTTGNTIGPHIVAGSGVVRPPSALRPGANVHHNPGQPPSRPSLAPLTLSNPPGSNFVRPNMRSVSDNYTGNMHVRPSISGHRSPASSTASPNIRPRADPTYTGGMNYAIATESADIPAVDTEEEEVTNEQDTDTLDFDANSVGMSDLFDRAINLETGIRAYGIANDNDSQDEYDDLEARLNKLQEPSVRIVAPGLTTPTAIPSQMLPSMTNTYRPPVRPSSNAMMVRPLAATTSSIPYRRPSFSSEHALSLPSRPTMHGGLPYVPVVRPRPSQDMMQVRPYAGVVTRPPPTQ
ncbi:hypothetical protein HDU99_006284 [Rhizoclosmatium hyalinum]|nr:hypothetical protein HDU99_006284 [Rhizoclosmatium hyalinum]